MRDEYDIRGGERGRYVGLSAMELLSKLLTEHEAWQVDWGKLTPFSADHDPEYKPTYSPLTAQVRQFMDAAEQGQLQQEPALFESGQFKLHSGDISSWRINVEALTSTDLATVASWAADRIGRFGSVEGVPTGGLRLAESLSPYATEGPLLIVDDVLTTGSSMEKQRAGRDAIGFVIFARGACPTWVTAMWQQSRQAGGHVHSVSIRMHRVSGYDFWCTGCGAVLTPVEALKSEYARGVADAAA